MDVPVAGTRIWKAIRLTPSDSCGVCARGRGYDREAQPRLATTVQRVETQGSRGGRRGGVPKGPDKGVRGDQRPAELQQEKSVLAFICRQDGQHAATDEIERQVQPRLRGEPAALRSDERREDEQGAGNLNDLVHTEPPSRAVVRPGTARTLVRAVA